MRLLFDDNFRRRVIDAVAYEFHDTRTNRSLLVELHGEAFSSNLCPTCENEHILAYIQLKRLVQNDFKMKAKKYKFNPKRENETISLAGVKGRITAETLTDELAKKILATGAYNDLIVEVEKPVKKSAPKAATKD